MKKTLALLSIVALTTACNKPSEPLAQHEPVEKTTPTNVTIEKENKVNISPNSAKSTLNWNGIYYGLMPCASCPGINTQIRLNEDGTYKLRRQYLESDDGVKVSAGSVKWLHNGNTVQIDDVLYKVTSDKLIALDKDGNQITGDLAKNYELDKINLDANAEENKHLKRQKYTTEDGQEYYVTFLSRYDTPICVINTGDEEIVLFQQEAWSKGGIYIGENSTLTAKGDAIYLQVGNKKTTLKIED